MGLIIIVSLLRVYLNYLVGKRGIIWHLKRVRRREVQKNRKNGSWGQGESYIMKNEGLYYWELVGIRVKAKKKKTIHLKKKKIHNLF